MQRKMLVVFSLFTLLSIKLSFGMEDPLPIEEPPSLPNISREKIEEFLQSCRNLKSSKILRGMCTVALFSHIIDGPLEESSGIKEDKEEDYLFELIISKKDSQAKNAYQIERVVPVEHLMPLESNNWCANLCVGRDPLQ